MKKLLLLIGCASLTGCFGPDVAKAIKALGNDPASVHLRVSSVYGVVEFTRTAPKTNSLPHTVSPDGTITVDGVKPVAAPPIPEPLRGGTRP